MKRIVTYLLPLLVVMAYFFFPPVRCSAKVEVTEEVKKAARDVITTFDNVNPPAGTKQAHCNGYLLYRTRDGKLGLWLMPAPYEVFFGSDSIVGFKIAPTTSQFNNRGYYYESNASGKNFTFQQSRGTDNSSDPCYFTTWSNWGSDSSESLADTVVACNFNFVNEAGKVFFHLAPLTDRLSAVAAQKLETEMVQNRKTDKGEWGLAPGMEKIAKTGMMIVIGTIISFLLLVTFIKKSLGLLVK